MALSLYREVLGNWQETGSSWWQLQSHLRIGAVNELFGRLDEASRAFLEARNLARDLGRAEEEILHMNRLVRIALAQQDSEKAEERLELASELARNHGDPELLALVAGSRASLLYQKGNIDAATNAFIEVSERWEAMGKPLE